MRGSLFSRTGLGDRGRLRRPALRAGLVAAMGIALTLLPAGVASAGVASISVTPSSAAAGRTISVQGSGWKGYDSVTVTLVEGTSSTFVCDASTDGSGVLNQDCTVPTDLVHGAYKLTGADGTSTAATPFTLDPGVRVPGFNGNAAAVRVAAGQTLGLTGAGFAPSSTLKATFNGTAVALSPAAATGATGAFSGSSFVVPQTTAQGRYSLVVKDSSGDSST